MNAKGARRGHRFGEIPTTPSPALSYLIGCYLSDGHISRYRVQHQFILVTTDRAYMESVRAAWVLLGRNPYVREFQPKAGYTIGPGRSPVCRRKRVYRLVAGCKGLSEWVVARGDVLVDEALAHPWDFLRGLYEGDGSLFWKYGPNRSAPRLALSVLYNTDRALVRRVFHWLQSCGYRPRFYEKSLGRALPIYEVRLGWQDDIASFLNRTRPAIKTTPRSHVNTEPRPRPRGKV